MTKRIDQFYTTVSNGDSVSGQILNLQTMLRDMGYQSDIFCEQIPIQFEHKTWQMMQYSRFATPENILLLHYSLNYSQAVIDWLGKIPSRKIIVYHNITPHAYFAGINDVFYGSARLGRKQLPLLQTLTEAGWGDSDFNCRELAENGWQNPQVLPIIFNPARLQQHPNRKLLKQLLGVPNILFVGRMAPNKRIEDLILIFYYLKRHILPQARLFLIGSMHGMERYVVYLQALITQLNLSDVIFTGHVSPAEWTSYYRAADIFLSMSEHEGFGIPFLESMHFELPVIAYKVGAVSETLGGSGVLVIQKNFPAIAELIGIILEDKTLQERITTRQRERLQDFLPANVLKRLQKLLQTFEV